MTNYKWDKEGFQPRTPADVMLELETWMPQYTDKHKFVLLYHKEFVDFVQTQVDAAYEEGKKEKRDAIRLAGLNGQMAGHSEGFRIGLKSVVDEARKLSSQENLFWPSSCQTAIENAIKELKEKS